MSPIVRRVTRALFLAGLLTTLQALPGAAAECELTRDDGTTRDCTFTEKYGKCLVTALDSHEDCIKYAETFLQRTVCDAAVHIDMMACHLGLVGEVGRLVSPL